MFLIDVFIFVNKINRKGFLCYQKAKPSKQKSTVFRSNSPILKIRIKVQKEVFYEILINNFNFFFQSLETVKEMSELQLVMIESVKVSR